MLITDNILFLKIRKAKSIVRCLVEQYPKSFLINSDNQYKTYTKANTHNYKQVLALGTNNEYKINQNWRLRPNDFQSIFSFWWLSVSVLVIIRRDLRRVSSLK